MMVHDINYYRIIQGTTDCNTSSEAEIRAIKNDLLHDFESSLDCVDVVINNVSQKLLVTSTQSELIKRIKSKPDEFFNAGDIITWEGKKWIVFQVDEDDRIRRSGRMRLCNTTLTWQKPNGFIVERTGYADKSTSSTDEQEHITVGDSNIVIVLSLDAETVVLNKGKRFLIDSTNYISEIIASGGHPVAYRLINRNVLTRSFGEYGCIELTLEEDQFQADTDNEVLMIADYRSSPEVADGEWL